MIKKFAIISICVMLFPIVFFVYAFADAAYLVDDANLLSQSEEAALQSRLSALSNKTGCDVVIVTVNSLGTKDATQYADDYYDYNGYRDDGILLLISIEQRDWAISTAGKAIRTFTDARQRTIMEDVKKSLSRDDYYTAFSDFINWCDYYLTNTGKQGSAAGTIFNWEWVFISLGIGVVIAFIVVSVMKGQLKSVRYQPAAESYVKRNSLNITRQNDFFLFRRISRTAIPKSSGSSTHRSSSGRTHGGSRGKF